MNIDFVCKIQMYFTIEQYVSCNRSKSGKSGGGGDDAEEEEEE